MRGKKSYSKFQMVDSKGRLRSFESVEKNFTVIFEASKFLQFQTTRVSLFFIVMRCENTSEKEEFKIDKIQILQSLKRFIECANAT